jgi:hypothetical protein
MADAAELHRRHCFLVETHDAPDALVRVLTLFAVQGADLAAVGLTRAQAGLSIRIEADGLGEGRAELLVARLGGLPSCAASAWAGAAWRGPRPEKRS